MGDSDKLPDSGPGSYRFVEHRRYLDALLEALDVRERGSRPSRGCKFHGWLGGRHLSGGASGNRLRPVRLGAAIGGMTDCAAATAPLSSPAPSAHRCAAAGLDSSTAAERLASMPSTVQWIA